MSYTASVRGKAIPSDKLNNSELEFLKSAGDLHYFRKRNRIIKIEDVNVDQSNQTVSFRMAGKHYAVNILDQVDLLIEHLGYSDHKKTGLNLIKAPMPGLVIDIMKKTGDTVKSGDPLLILEAMKMENVIKSPIAGVIKNILIKTSDSVDKHQLLIELEE